MIGSKRARATAVLGAALLALAGACGAVAAPHNWGGHREGGGHGGGGYGAQGHAPAPRAGDQAYPGERPTYAPPAWGRGAAPAAPYGARGYGGGYGYGAPPAYGRGFYPPAPRYAYPAGPGRWRRGEVLPPGFRGYPMSDYARYHLRRPPRGYYWYRTGGDFILVAAATGLIFDVISAGE